MTEPVRKNSLLTPSEFAASVAKITKGVADTLPNDGQKLAYYRAVFEAFGNANGFPRRG